MTKIELTANVMEECNVSKDVAQRAIESVLGTILDAACAGEEVNLRHYFTIKPIVRKAKPARNICKNETIHIPARRRIKFILSRYYTGILNDIVV